MVISALVELREKVISSVTVVACDPVAKSMKIHRVLLHSMLGRNWDATVLAESYNGPTLDILIDQGTGFLPFLRIVLVLSFVSH